jgi:hypothetical protein
MFFNAEKSYFKLLSVVFVVFVFFSADLKAQKKKTPAEKKKAQTSSQPTAKSAKNQTAKNQANDKKADKNSTAKNTPDASKKDKTANNKNVKDKTATAAKTRQADAKKQAEERRLAEIRQAEEARRREIEAARRQAALEEKRRREEIARQARARAVAFERGLRTETIENIANDNTTGEDLEVRRAAVSALGNRAGMIVVMEAQTGKVLSIVNQDWAIKRGYKPCSTIKLVTAIGGLNENLINGYDGSIPARPFPMNLNDALAFSNNKYFQNVGYNLGNKKILSYAQMLGLGRPTGINSEGETGGRLPFGNSNARVYSHGDDFEVSPLQLAVMVSTISNGGKIVVPNIPRTRFEQTNFNMTTRGTINLSLNKLQGVIPGMIGAGTYGTARRGVNSSLGIAGKTGSCIGQGSWLGLFASVAPVANPKLAVVVITRGQAERGKFAAAIAGRIYQSLSNRLREQGVAKPLIAQTPAVVKPQPKIDAKTAALLDEEAEGVEESEDNDALSKGKKGGADNDVKNDTFEKPVKKTGSSNPVFSPVIITVKKKNPETTPTAHRF